jgi:uncharacterized membrane protein YbaN (DUF454 family)
MVKICGGLKNSLLIQKPFKNMCQDYRALLMERRKYCTDILTVVTNMSFFCTGSEQFFAKITIFSSISTTSAYKKLPHACSKGSIK